MAWVMPFIFCKLKTLVERNSAGSLSYSSVFIL
jgi:hypothetical protein